MDELTSKKINLLIRNFRVASYNSPEVFERIADYVVEHEDSILPTTLHRVLSCFYALGFQPESGNRFTHACHKILEIDCAKLACHELLECCLALCLCKALSSELIHYVFSVEFLDQLEQETAQRGYSKIYPRLVRSLLMKLNRAVCLDHPEEKVPWFHEKYCRDECEFESDTVSPLEADVRGVLASLLGDRDLIRVNKKSAYYYTLDLEFGLSYDGRPVPARRLLPKAADDDDDDPTAEPFKRVALLLRTERCYSSNDRRLAGPCQLERRHLEILGYVVVEVADHAWYSMAVGSQRDKRNLLKSLIYTQLNNVVS